MSYFAKPNFISHDEWFDYDLEKNELDVKTKKTKPISNIHEFFYERSNYKVGASENNFELYIKANEKELITNNYFEKSFKKTTSLSIKQFLLFEKFTNSKLKFITTKKLIYSLSIFGFLFIVGFLLFFILQSKKNESNLINTSFVMEKDF